ncbi:dipeptidase PepE [Dendronalium sp. ChiSLP03b]|uniref:dipeptidase PepE n=1 Tax=Dendronalium sp. ChiSLP03b TaxID=3075381 RepID=UPI002AD21B3F|nr:dipeptidase PepE [Dendronalium sp. ChiSLP03b]MDZ8203497.1 dipeptidase PepE [Dendronalium sp. ChiSLP03b]
MSKRLLLLSNSTNIGEEYLSYPRQEIQNFLGDAVNKIVFIPYAAVTSTYEEYSKKVAQVFQEIGYEVDAIHLVENPQELIKDAEAIVVGGGNTFHLIHWLHKTKLLDVIKNKVNNGTPYIGWSAGSNVACPTIKTSNDMPIIEPISFQGLNLVHFQINPHYTDEVMTNHNGETREQRIKEFLVLNPNIYVVGLPEGTMLRVEDSSMRLIGNKKIFLFKFTEERKEYDTTDKLDFLLKTDFPISSAF